MAFFGGVIGLVFFGLWVFCVIDVITTPAARCRNLPKIVWVFVVVLLVDPGSIAWLIAGRPRVGAFDARAAAGRSVSARSAHATRINPDDDAEFLASLRHRVDEQRRRGSKPQPGDHDPPPESP